MQCYRDLWGGGADAYNHFTMEQTIGPTAIMTLYLAAQDHALELKNKAK